MRKALVTGIDFYSSTGVSQLHGCVNDAHSIASVLQRNADGTINFDVRLITGTGAKQTVTRRQIKEAAISLFADDADIAFFYFSGHGFIDGAAGYICGSDTSLGDDGFSLIELLNIANDSNAKNKIIVLDSCHSGFAGQTKPAGSVELSQGLTILTASTGDQYATEKNGRGVFTELFVDALNGGAANLVGDVTPGSIYAHIDQSLGSWEQRPVFRTNVKNFVSLRKVEAPISLDDLHQLPQLFPDPAFQFQLNPSYEPKSSAPDPGNTLVFATLQRLAKVNLVKPVGEDHLYFAAMNNKSCRLTVLGEHYRRLVKLDRI